MQNQSGTIPHIAGANLTGKEGFLVDLSHDNGTPEVILPTSFSTSRCPYVVKYGDAEGKRVDVDPLSPHEISTLKLQGTCNPGDRLCLADQTTAADAGKVRTLPAPVVAATDYMVHAVAEEAGVEGQLVRVRPVAPYPVTVPAA